MNTSSSVDPRQSLAAHALERGLQIHASYGPKIGWNQLLQLLEDRSCVRYPCQILFDAAELEPGEVAYAAPQGTEPEQGFTIYVHPHFQGQLDRVPLLVFYQMVVVNYGPFASAEDAELFGAAALGLEREAYYQTLCAMADEIL